MPRICTLLLALVGFSIAASADAQTCTHGPYASNTSLASINSTVDSAPNGSVVCLRRGNRWTQSGGSAIDFSTTHPNASRVTICSSDDSQCTDSVGGANARITMSSGECFGHGSGSGDGYTIKDIDCFGANTCSDHNLEAQSSWNEGVRDITYEGGVYDGWNALHVLYNGNGSNPTNVKFGTCAKPLTFQNCVASSARYVQYGACTDCTFAFDLKNWGGTNGSGGFVHILDFNLWDSSAPVTDKKTENVTVECGHWQVDSGAVDVGSVVKAAWGTNLVFRDMVVEETRVGGGGYDFYAPLAGVHIEGHNYGVPGIIGWDGAQIYRNKFLLGNSAFATILSRVGKNINIYNNVFRLKGGASPNYYGMVIQTSGEGQATPAWAPDNVRAYNNTIYSQDAAEEVFDFQNGTGHHVYNNLVHHAGQSGYGAPILNGDCSRFGTNGANIHDNLIYSPGTSSPVIPNCSGARAWLPGAPWNTAPGLDSAFGLLSTSSYANGKGTAAGAPTSDFNRVARPNPPSVGAFEVGGPPAAPDPDPDPTPDPDPDPTPPPPPDPDPDPTPDPGAPLTPVLLP